MERPGSPETPPLDEIVARVMAEAERRRAAAAPPGPPRWADLASAAGIGGPGVPAPSPAPSGPAFTPRADRRYAIGDFLALHGAAFVTASYRGLLGREPDAAGHRHWLGQLLEGMPRAEVLARLRWSAEGRAHGATVAGLAPRAAAAAVARLPLAGPVAGWVLAVATASRTARALRALEARHAIDLERLAEALARGRTR